MVKGDLVKCTEGLRKRQGVSIAQLNKVETEKSGNECRFEILSSAISMLKDKLAEGTSMTCMEITQIREVPVVHSSPTPLLFANLDNVARTGNASCSFSRY